MSKGNEESGCVSSKTHSWKPVTQIPVRPIKSDDEVIEFYCKRCTKRIWEKRNWLKEIKD